MHSTGTSRSAQIDLRKLVYNRRLAAPARKGITRSVMLLFLLVEVNLVALWGLVTVVFVRTMLPGMVGGNDGVANNVKSKTVATILIMGQIGSTHAFNAGRKSRARHQR